MDYEYYFGHCTHHLNGKCIRIPKVKFFNEQAGICLQCKKAYHKAWIRKYKQNEYNRIYWTHVLSVNEKTKYLYCIILQYIHKRQQRIKNGTWYSNEFILK